MSFSSVHYIHTIKEALVVKIRVDLIERPSKRLKKISEIYKSEGATSGIELSPKFSQLEDRLKGSSTFGCNGKVEGEMPLSAMGRTAKCGQRTIEINDDMCSYDSTDLSFSEMTLKEFKFICKSKKRKISKAINSKRFDVESSNLHRGSPVQIIEESEMHELSFMKLRQSKKLKSERRNHLERGQCSSTELDDSEEVSTEWENTCNYTLNEVKSEVIEMNVACSEDWSAKICYEGSKSSGGSDDDIDGGQKVTQQSIPSIEKANLSGDLSVELPESVNGIESRDSDPLSENSVGLLNESSIEYFDCSETLLGSVDKIYSMTTGMSSSERTIHESPFVVSEVKTETQPTHLLSASSPEAVPVQDLPNDCVADVQRKCVDERPLELQVSTDSNKEVTPGSEDHSANDSNGLNIAPQKSPLCFNSTNSLHSCGESSLMAEEIISSSTVEKVVDTSGQSPSDAKLIQTGTETLREYSPKRLFSTRKAISPTSQEKLLQAVEAEELQESIQISSLEEADRIEGSQKATKKSKFTSRNGSPPLVIKSILKTQESDCPSVHTHSQKAILFSQRQMHDIESLSVKLLKGLKSMKNIVEETLLSDACPSAYSKVTSDEMRKAADNANELEETTRKWLSIMSRDCSRFCKIMNSAERKATDTNVATKEQRKISFADEVGFRLCHVKVFEENPTSLLVSENVKTDEQS